MSAIAPKFDSATPVSANDSTDDPFGPFAGFYTGAGGNIKVHTCRGDDVTFSSAAAGIVIECAISRVWSTGTTVSPKTSILGLFGSPFQVGLHQRTTGGKVTGRTDPST